MGRVLKNGTSYLTCNAEGMNIAPSILKGTDAPSPYAGVNGQIYLRHAPILENVDIRDSISNGANGAYINTGYMFNSNTRIEFKCKIPSSTSNYPTPFGTRVNNTGREAHQLYVALSNTRIYYAFGNSEGYVDGAFTYDTDVVFKTVPVYLESNQAGVTKYVSSGVFPVANAQYPLYFFVADIAGSPWTSTWAVMTFYYCKIYEGDILVHYYLPAVDPNNVACIYDCIDGTYFHNAGSGSFTVGNPITPDSEIYKSYCKVNNSWQDLIGTSITDIPSAYPYDDSYLIRTFSGSTYNPLDISYTLVDNRTWKTFTKKPNTTKFLVHVRNGSFSGKGVMAEVLLSDLPVKTPQQDAYVTVFGAGAPFNMAKGADGETIYVSYNGTASPTDILEPTNSGTEVPQMYSGTFTTASTQGTEVTVECGFQPDYVWVKMEFSTGYTYAYYIDPHIASNGRVSVWDLRPIENHAYQLIAPNGTTSDETGISDVTSSGFKYMSKASNTLNKSCTFIAYKFS